MNFVKRITTSNSFRKFLRVNIFIFPYLTVLTYTFLLLDSIVYPGFTQNIFLIDSMWLMPITLISICIAIITAKYTSKSVNSIFFNFLNVNKLAMPIVVVVYFLSSLLEQQNYPNFVFSHYHLHIGFFTNVLILNVYIILIEILLDYNFLMLKFIKIPDLTPRNISKIVILLLIVAIISYPVIRTFINITKMMIYHASLVIKNPNLNFDERSRKVITNYSYYKFLVEHTPESALIGVPPQRNPWLTIGNIGMVRYFLYPRKITQEPDKTKVPLGVDYLVISSGDWASMDGKYGWPESTVSAKRAWLYDIPTGEVTTYENFTFDIHSNPELRKAWGLLEL